MNNNSSSPSENRRVLKKQTRAIGIDFGMVRIGLAYSDATKMIAAPLCVVNASKRSEETILKTVETLHKHESELNYTIETIVIGLPLNMDGSTGFIADEVHHFANLLKEHFTCPIVLWDERLTSVQADRAMREGMMNRKKRAKHIDTVSAVILLQNWLDHKYIC